MSGTPNPALIIRELNGNLTTTPNVGEGVILKIGSASAYITGKPFAVSSQSTVNRSGVGTVVSSLGPHIENSGKRSYLMRVLPSTAGSFGTVVKHPISAPASPGTLALSAATFDARNAAPDPLPGGAALDIGSGFAEPPSPLPLTVVTGAGTVAHTITLDYYDEEDIARQTTIAVSGVGTFTTSTGVQVNSIIRYRTDIDPVGTSTLSYVYSGPLDRFDHLLWRVTRGGQLSVTGAQQPQLIYSFDNGNTFAPAVTVPSTGIVDLYTYPGGLTRWHTGIRATFTQNTVSSTLYGAYRAAGATVNGDTVWTFAVAGASIQTVVPTIASSLVFTNTGSAVTVTAETTGGVAASYAGFGLRLTGLAFTAAVVGTGGNSITVETVADGTGAGSVSVVGNAITIHYETMVTTVTDVKSHFPVSTTFASVAATGGTGANVLAAAGDTHAATNLASGANATLVSTAADIKTFFDTDTSAGTLAAHLYINRVTTVGTGLGAPANAGPGLAADGAISWTAKKPNVQVRHLVSGNSTAADIVVAGLDVTIISATDTNGAETSTANAILTLLALPAHADAALLISGVVSGAGTGIIGNWDYVALAQALAQGDEWTSYTTPPLMTLGDCQTAFNTLSNTYLKTLQNIEHVELVQDSIDNNIYQAFQTWLLYVKDNKHIPLWGSSRALYKSPSYTTDAAWATALIAALPSPRSAGGLIALGGGEQDTIVTVYGCQMAMNVIDLDMARCMNVQISQSPNQTRCNVLTADGTQFALTGTGLHSIAVGTDEKQALWEGEDALLDVHAQNVTTNRTLVEYDGVFIRQTLNYVDDGNDFIFWERRRVMNRAYRVVNRSLIVFLNANLLTDPTTGTLAEVEAQQIERTVGAALSGGGLLNDNGINHCSAFNFSVSRFEQTARTLTVVWALTIIPLAKVLRLDGTIGFAVTISDTFSVGTT